MWSGVLPGTIEERQLAGQRKRSRQVLSMPVVAEREPAGWHRSFRAGFVDGSFGLGPSVPIGCLGVYDPLLLG